MSLKLSKSMLTGLTFILIIGCSKTVTKLNSINYNDPSERVDIISEELKVYSIIYDAEFDLFNVNGFESQAHAFMDVPGASSWFYISALKVDPNEVMNWIDGMIEVDSLAYEPAEWISQIISHRKENWITSSSPRFFEREIDAVNQKVELIVYEKEGIIFKYILNE